MKRTGLLGALVALTLGGCGGQSVAERCQHFAAQQHRADYAAAVKWADGFIASQPDPGAISPARKASLIAGAANPPISYERNCEANPARYLH